MDKYIKKDAQKISISIKETITTTEYILKQVQEQDLLINKLKEDLKKAPWEKHIDTIRH